MCLPRGVIQFLALSLCASVHSWAAEDKTMVGQDVCLSVRAAPPKKWWLPAANKGYDNASCCFQTTEI